MTITKVFNRTMRIHDWAVKARWRRRLVACVCVPLGVVYTFVEFTVLAWIEWARNWRELWIDVREFWK